MSEATARESWDRNRRPAGTRMNIVACGRRRTAAEPPPFHRPCGMRQVHKARCEKTRTPLLVQWRAARGRATKTPKHLTLASFPQ